MRARPLARTGRSRSPVAVEVTFSINRAGDNLDAADRKRLEAAKDELRKAFPQGRLTSALWNGLGDR
jgi:hypothetical protein